MTEPIKCPFCGMIIMNIRNRGGVLPFAVECGKCQAMTKYFATEEEAVEAWNTRKPVENVLERLEEEHRKSEECPKFEKAFRQVAFEEAIKIVKEGLK